MTMTANKTENMSVPGIISADQAYEMSQKGEIILIDVRTPMEWMRSGVPEGALTIAPQNPTFMDEINEAVGGDMAKPIALICATGQRTAAIKRFLDGQGYTAVADVSEGMMGNFSAPGWLRKNLPVAKYSG